MLQRTIGASGLSASAIGLGTWAIGGSMWGGSDDTSSIRAIEAAVASGITLIDTAPGYGLGHAETLVGRALKGKRHEVVIATKCGLNWTHGRGTRFFEDMGKEVYRYLGRDGILHEVDESLRRLNTDYIDLYITHWQDATTPIEETMRTLDDLKAVGKIRAIGASNLSGDDLETYVAAGGIDAIQERYSLIDREIETTLLPMAKRNDIATLSYSPLALGLLTGLIGPERQFLGDDIRRDNPRFSVANRRRLAGFATDLKDVAAAHGASVAQIVIAWTVQRSGIDFVLCGARSPEHSFENARAGMLDLNASDVAAVDAAAARWLVGLDS
jgi:methylglyoxal reductase